MKTFKEFLVEGKQKIFKISDKSKLVRFTVYKVGLSGKLSHREELNADELDKFIDKVYGKWATIKIVATNDKGKTIEKFYTDDGEKFTEIKM